MSLEKRLEQRLRIAVKRRGGIALKFYCLSYTGMPDRIILMPGGKVYFVELKSEYKKPSPRQAFVHEQLRQLGFDVSYMNTEEQLTSFLDRIIQN
ncbi:VRR-NUC domain-containing protein [Bacteroides sedimenti]|uniref:VRR-NUC domain-containing protein n=1 Tax=Bacteroides sedimenti TaxID=2136147 RepID=A0ABN6Z649_9BACE